MPYLILKKLDGSTAAHWSLNNQITTVGRDVSVNAPVDDPELSRQHFTITPSADGRYTLKDLGSRNGTRVNGKPVVEHVLQTHDTIQAGKSQFLIMDGLNTITFKVDQEPRR